MPSKLYIFDLDKTLWDHIDVYPNTHKILRELRKRGHLVYLASFNPNAIKILKELEIVHYFHGGVYGDISQFQSKYAMIEQIRKILKFEGKVEFYDDMMDNLLIVKKNDPSIKTIFIEEGIKWSDVFYNEREPYA